MNATTRLSGLALIAQERERQIVAEGYDASHDDSHTDSEIALAAVCYAHPDPPMRWFHHPSGEDRGDRGWSAEIPKEWPWRVGDYNPGDDRIRELVKAGALIAAEIDRLQRAALADERNADA